MCPGLGCANTGCLCKAEHPLLLDLAQNLLHQPTPTSSLVYLVTPIIFPIIAGVAVSQGDLSDGMSSLDALPPAQISPFYRLFIWALSPPASQRLDKGWHRYKHVAEFQ